jgi:hypothetical protein
MTARVTFVVSFDRIGRHDDPDPLTVTLADGTPAAVCGRLAQAVRAYAEPLYPALRVDAAVNAPRPRRGRPLATADLDGVTGFVLDAGRLVGRFIAEIAPDHLVGVAA